MNWRRWTNNDEIIDEKMIDEIKYSNHNFDV